MYAVHAAGTALWLDPGTRLQRRIGLVDQILEREGIFVLEEQPHLGEYIHKETALWLGLEQTNIPKVPLLSYSCVGLRESSLAYERVALALADCVAHDRCISPEGLNALQGSHELRSQSTFPHQRLDQAVLSVVASLSNLDIHANLHSSLCTHANKNSTPDPAALIVLPGAEYAEMAEVSARSATEVIYQQNSCVQVIHGKGQGHRGKVLWYELRGLFQVRLDDGNDMVLLGSNLVACSSHRHDAEPSETEDSLFRFIRNCTNGGIIFQFEQDIQGNDLEVDEFVHILKRAVTKEACFVECWLNDACFGLSYDMETGECWPKSSADTGILVKKTTVMSGLIDVSVRSHLNQQQRRERCPTTKFHQSAENVTGSWWCLKVDAQAETTPGDGLFFPLHKVVVEANVKTYLVMDMPGIEMIDILLSDFSGAFNVPYNATLLVEWKQGAQPLWAVAHGQARRRAEVQVHVMKYVAIEYDMRPRQSKWTVCSAKLLEGTKTLSTLPPERFGPARRPHFRRRQRREHGLVSVCTQLTVDRLDRLAMMAQNYGGPISAVLYIGFRANGTEQLHA